jgi:hypothetical protein
MYSITTFELVSRNWECPKEALMAQRGLLKHSDVNRYLKFHGVGESGAEALALNRAVRSHAYAGKWC